ncbi:hypothetical protein NC651_020007 [Populus alba x Populus x berolinensis]|nr:hypothetical protein NC651_020007 [Populus alba x Populus x berolinensis]
MAALPVPAGSVSLFERAGCLIGLQIGFYPHNKRRTPGVIPAFLLITIIAWLVDISVDFLLRYTHSEDTTTYTGVMRAASGRGMYRLEMSMMDQCTSSLLEDHGENSVAMLKFPENMEFNEGSHTDSSVKESD